MKKAWKWLSENRLWLVSIFISVASSPGDGGYLSRFMWPGLAYTFNFGVDAATELIAYGFIGVWRGKSKWRQAWSLLLIPFIFGLSYYSVVFAHAEFAIKGPDTAPYLLWSLASFGPAALVGLGIAQAVTEIHKRKESTAQPVPAPAPILPKADRQAALLTLVTGKPTATYKQLAEKLGVSHTTIGTDLQELVRAGKIERNNGQGTRVLM